MGLGDANQRRRVARSTLQTRPQPFRAIPRANGVASVVKRNLNCRNIPTIALLQKQRGGSTSEPRPTDPQAVPGSGPIRAPGGEVN